MSVAKIEIDGKGNTTTKYVPVDPNDYATLSRISMDKPTIRDFQEYVFHCPGRGRIARFLKSLSGRARSEGIDDNLYRGHKAFTLTDIPFSHSLQAAESNPSLRNCETCGREIGITSYHGKVKKFGKETGEELAHIHPWVKSVFGKLKIPKIEIRPSYEPKD